MAILKAAVEEIDDQRTQANILEVLVNRAASFAPRVAFFVIKNEQATGWRARGFEGTVGDDAIREISLPLASDTLLGDVVRSRTVWSGSPGANAEDHVLLGQLGSEPPQRMVAIPLVVRDKSVAVLYADSAALESDAINLEALETLVRVADMAVELLSLSRNAARPQRTRPQVSGRPSVVEEEREEQPAAVETQAPEEEAPPPVEEEEEPAAPVEAGATREEESAAETVEGEAVSEPESMDDGGAQAAHGAAAPAAWDETPTVEAQAPVIEEKGVAPFIPSTPSWADAGAQPSTDTSSTGPTHAQPQPAQPEQYGGPRLGASRRYGSTDTELPVEVSEDERRLHNDARRFARLLVSEIKLYNEQKVKEGRAQGNIYERLREDIDRSRQMYDKRVAPPVAARYDYFHQELVNTLAEGDPSKLGAAYPGAAVSA
jgi:hypothetical protein